jgi:2-C-methyl-D-erythritol 4-phosphate cytidylyltransferase
VKTAARDETGAVRIGGTLDRSFVWLAQTPQMFRSGLLMRALAQAPGATDEASAVEALNLKPRLVVGSRENLKVTYAEDLPIAASILERRV